MLYPIELLRHESTTRNAVRGTACMLTTCPAFVMSSLFLSVGNWYCPEGWIGQTAMPRPPFICPWLAHPSKSAICHYPVQDRDGRRFCPFPLSARRYGTTTQSDGHKMRTCCFFQSVRIFLMKGAGITPLPGSEFVTELAPMIWQF